jgi:hypothetical protein
MHLWIPNIVYPTVVNGKFVGGVHLSNIYTQSLRNVDRERFSHEACWETFYEKSKPFQSSLIGKVS